MGRLRVCNHVTKLEINLETGAFFRFRFLLSPRLDRLLQPRCQVGEDQEEQSRPLDQVQDPMLQGERTVPYGLSLFWQSKRTLGSTVRSTIGGTVSTFGSTVMYGNAVLAMGILGRHKGYVAVWSWCKVIRASISITFLLSASCHSQVAYHCMDCGQRRVV